MFKPYPRKQKKTGREANGESEEIESGNSEVSQSGSNLSEGKYIFSHLETQT